MRETSLYPEITKALEGLGAAVTKIPGTPYHKGIPDYALTLRGHPIWMEVKVWRKSKKEMPTALQQENLDKHAVAGSLSFCLVWDDVTKMYRIEYSSWSLACSRKELRQLFVQVFNLTWPTEGR